MLIPISMPNFKCVVESTKFRNQNEFERKRILNLLLRTAVRAEPLIHTRVFSSKGLCHERLDKRTLSTVTTKVVGKLLCELNSEELVEFLELSGTSEFTDKIRTTLNSLNNVDGIVKKSSSIVDEMFNHWKVSAFVANLEASVMPNGEFCGKSTD